MKVLIPAKGISSRVPSKNLAILAEGKSLVQWTIENFKRWLPSVEIFVATEDERISKIATDLECEIYPITEDDINDRRTCMDLFYEFATVYPQRPLILAQCTSPFTLRSELELALNPTDSVSFSGYHGSLHYLKYRDTLSQYIEPAYVLGGNFYIIHQQGLPDRSVWFDKNYMTPTTLLSLLDINTQDDLENARWLAKYLTQSSLD